MFDQFLQERKYLLNCSPKTLRHYESAFRWYDPDPKCCVMKMREAGLRPVSCNSYITMLNAYLHWKGETFRIPKLKFEHPIPPTFSHADISKIMKVMPISRVQVLLLTLADTGLRLGEALGLTWDHVDMDGLMLRVMGKGRKERLVPFSTQLRRFLFRVRKTGYVFQTASGLPLSQRNALRDAKQLCKQLSIVPPPRTMHAMRHGFALNFVRQGGSVFHLMRLLGHTTLTMSQRYVALTTADLKEAHRSVLTSATCLT